MRRSFGPMGGGGGGGAMMRTVHRAVRTSSGGRGGGGGGSSQEPFSHFTSNYNNTTSSNTSTRPTYKPSSSSDNNNSIISLSSSHHHHPVNYLNSNEYDDYVFATVPSMDEVNHALSSLQQFVDPPTNSQDSGWEHDWIEPSPSMLHPRGGSQNVSDAFRLLQTESSVQKMVVSLASDKSVWEAVMKNEAVRELRDSVNEVNKSTSGRDAETSEGSIPLSEILDWIFINTKAKVMEVLEKTIKMVSNLFQSPRNEKNAKGDGDEGAAIGPFEKKLRSSFLLSVLVMLIVVVSRASRS